MNDRDKFFAYLIPACAAAGVQDENGDRFGQIVDAFSACTDLDNFLRGRNDFAALAGDVTNSFFLRRRLPDWVGRLDFSAVELPTL